MKRLLLSSVIALTFFSCSKSDDNNRCSFLLNVGVSESLNLSLPQYQDLQFNLLPVYIPGQGNGGLVVIKTLGGYLAWDASDPNHAPSSCSVLQINGIEGTCGCEDGNTYEFVTGQAVGETDVQCTLKRYPVSQNGNVLLINN
jgi:hypothetical protein